MFRIGDFSRIARVSCRLLRYYDEIGLLSPDHVDAGSSYRYYSVTQLPRLNRILVLRELGFSLEQIASMIDDNLSANELRAMLTVRRADIERAVAEESQRLRQVEARIAQIDDEGELASDEVIVRAEPAYRVLSLRRSVTSFVAARGLIGELYALTRGRVRASLLGSLVAVAHSSEFEQDQIDVEFGFKLAADADVPPIDGLSVREFESVAAMAVCIRVGLPEQAHLVTARIGRFVGMAGYQLAGPSREVFLQRPRLERMEESVVEMQFPVCR